MAKTDPAFPEFLKGYAAGAGSRSKNFAADNREWRSPVLLSEALEVLRSVSAEKQDKPLLMNLLIKQLIQVM